MNTPACRAWPGWGHACKNFGRQAADGSAQERVWKGCTGGALGAGIHIAHSQGGVDRAQHSLVPVHLHPHACQQGFRISELQLPDLGQQPCLPTLCTGKLSC